MSKYKIGQALVSVDGSGVFEEAVIVAQHSDGRWILEVTKAVSDIADVTYGRLLSRGESTLDEYYKIKQEFFRVGRTYRNKLSPAVTYEVIEMYFAVTNDGREYTQALAWRRQGNAKEIDILFRADLGRMEEVK